MSTLVAFLNFGLWSKFLNYQQQRLTANLLFQNFYQQTSGQMIQLLDRRSCASQPIQTFGLTVSHSPVFVVLPAAHSQSNSFVNSFFNRRSRLLYPSRLSKFGRDPPRCEFTIFPCPKAPNWCVELLQLLRLLSFLLKNLEELAPTCGIPVTLFSSSEWIPSMWYL